MQISKSGWRLKEPIEFPREEPTVLRDVIRVHLREHHAAIEDLSDRAFLRKTEEFTEKFLDTDVPPLKVVGA
jgi:hypothetical protein